MANPAPDRPLVPGAGVDPRKVVRPSKRLRNWLRNWHRSERAQGGLMSLRMFARSMASGDSDFLPTAAAKLWLASKGVRL